MRTEQAADLEAAAQMVLVRSLLAQGKRVDAAGPRERLRALGAQSQDRRVRIAAAITGARFDAASGEKAAAALEALGKLLAEAIRVGFVDNQLEARLAAGEIEMASGRTAAAREHLAAVEKDAAARGFGLVARRARTASSASGGLP